jgi:hypothetical protein
MQRRKPVDQALEEMHAALVVWEKAGRKVARYGGAAQLARLSTAIFLARHAVGAVEGDAIRNKKANLARVEG